MRPDGTYYLNNSGSRWVILENGRRNQITLLTVSGREVTRRVNYYEAFGNFAVANISYKGKMIDVFPDTILPD